MNNFRKHQEAQSIAHAVIRHWEPIAVDMGEVHVNDLVDHYFSTKSLINPSDEFYDLVVAEVKKLNYGDDYFRP